MSLLSKVCMKMDFRGTTSVLVFLNCFVNDCFCLRNFFINEEYFIPGQEEENLDFLTNCGAALRTTKKYSLPVLLKVLIDDPSRLDNLRKNIKSIRKFDSAVNISNLVVDILTDNE